MEPKQPLLRRWYELHGLCLEVCCKDAGVMEAVHTVLPYFGISRRRRRAADLRLGFGTRPMTFTVPDQHGRRMRHNGIDVWSVNEAYYLRDGPSWVVVDPKRHRSAGVIVGSQWRRPGVLRIEFVNLVIHSVLLLLRDWDYFPLHAACLAKGDDGLLLVAPSDSGKSTQALNLVRSGWRYLSDDSILLRPVASSVRAHALRREFGLDEAAEARCPEIAGNRRPFVTDERKQRIHMAAVYPGQSADNCIPRAIVFPRIVDRRHSRLREVDGKEALFGLMQQTALLTIEPSSAARHVAVLRQLADQARCFALEAGRDVFDDPKSSDRLLRSCLAAG